MTETASPTDPLFATTPQAGLLSDRTPVVVIGLPRSGSSLLSHILSQVEDWYVFDDLYLSRHARQLGASDSHPMTRTQLKQLLHWLGWRIRARLQLSEYAKPGMTVEEIEPFNDALLALYAERLPTWQELQEEWMARLALRTGATRWGWKQPGAFRMLDTLNQAYPGLKTIYLMRRPESVLASYKYMDASNLDGDPRQYNIFAYSFYWRLAARSWIASKTGGRDRTFFLRFEDMTSDPQTTGERLAAFLESDIGDVSLPEKPNSSFAGGVSKGRKRSQLTGLETRILRSIAGRERDALFPDKPLEMPKLEVADLADIVGRFFVFLGYRIGLQRRRIMTRLSGMRGGKKSG